MALSHLPSIEKDVLFRALHISSAGMHVQGKRLRVVSENMANIDSLADKPGGDPYRRRIIIFQNKYHKNLNMPLVEIKKIKGDRTPFAKKYDPSNPAADQQGYVKTPNVNMFVELMDMREAERSYEANTNVLQSTKSMISRTIDILR